MKRIYFIAKNELYTLYYSPIAWLLMILFLILASADYIGITTTFLGLFQQGGPSLMLTNELTNNLISNPSSGYFFNNVIGNLYIIFPLVTMGLISREVSNGTIKLLYSSPIRVSEMVLGKFLAMIAFTLTLIVMLLFTLIALSLSISNPDYGLMLSSVIALFLLLCTYAAIGLFISSLTSYQIVAAIITFAVFAFLSHIGNLWQSIDLVRNITYYLNIDGRSFDLIQGLFNLRDVVYFLIIIACFLAFTIIKIRTAAESISKVKKMFRYIIVIVIAFIVGYITSSPYVNMYLDTTRNQIHTITGHTRKMVSKLNDGELNITVFANLLDSHFWNFLPSDQNQVNAMLWEPYIRFKPDIKIKWVYYYNLDTGSYWYKIYKGKTLKEIAEKEAKAHGMSLRQFLSPDQVNKLVNTDREGYRNFFQFKYKGKTSIVRTFDDGEFWPDENNIAAAINQLVATPPEIVFLKGQIERGPFLERVRDYKLIANQLGNRYALINQGFKFDTLSLQNCIAIPTDIAGLVIADPRTPFDQEDIAKIDNYIAAGGNLFIASEPDRKDVIKPLFSELGLSLKEGLLIQPSDKYSNDWVFPYLTMTAENITPQFQRQIKDNIKYYGDTLFRVAMGGADALQYHDTDNFVDKPLLYTDKAISWNRLVPISSDSLQLKVKRLPSDEDSSFVTAVLLERHINGKDQRIVAASDADYLTKPLLFGWEPMRYNYNFGFWCFSYFTYGKFPANTLRPEGPDNSFKIKVQDMYIQKLFLYYIIPLLIAIACSIVLIRRKRK